MSKLENTLALVDANSLLHRAYHALPPLTAPNGEMVGAVYGFASMFLNVLEHVKPNFMVVAWDTPKPTFRHQAYTQYKAQRPKTDEDLLDQVHIVKEFLKSLNVPQIGIEGYEADDVIGTLSKIAVDDGVVDKVFIVTGDMDALQLVNEKVQVMTTKKGSSLPFYYDVEAVKERYSGLTPAQVVDYKALRGDPSDNIPGVKGVGDKIAIQLLSDFGSIERLYEHICSIEPKYKKKLEDSQEDAFMSKKLATIITDVPLQFSYATSDMHKFRPTEIGLFLQSYGLKSLDQRWRTLAGELGLDGQTPVDATHAIELNDELPKGIGGIEDFDPQIAAYVLTSKTGKELSYDNLIFHYMGEQVEFESMDEKSQTAYLHTLIRLMHKEFKLDENKQLAKIFYDIEMPLRSVLLSMEEHGILVDRHLLDKKKGELEATIIDLTSSIFECVGHEFNLNSPKQLEEVLYDEIGLPVMKKTKTQRSTDESVLNQLKEAHPAIEKILEYRAVSKILSTYVDPLLIETKDDGRVHSHFNQIRTASGRLSSESPNVQNIPIEYGMRDVFIAPEGSKLIVADYSQIELRIMAHITGDSELLLSFGKNEDIHAATAARLFNKSLADVTEKDRKIGKTLNFSLLYGVTAYGLSEQLLIPQDEAQLLIEKFYEAYPSVKKWQEETIEFAKRHGYVETLFGRKRTLPAIRSKNYFQRAGAERIAINHPLQGTQADIIKMAMVSISKKTQELDGVHMILQVHDELVFEVDVDHVEEISLLIKEEMEGVVSLKVPAIVGVGVGQTWGQAK